MATAYTSVPPGDGNPDWLNWRDDLHALTVHQFFNELAERGQLGRNDRYVVAKVDGTSSFSVALVEFGGFTGRPTLEMTFEKDGETLHRAVPKETDGRDRPGTVAWLGTAYGWLRGVAGTAFGFTDMESLGQVTEVVADWVPSDQPAA